MTTSELPVHGGNVRAMAQNLGCAPEEILDFSSSLNPLGPPQWLRPVVARALAGTARYPEPRSEGLRRRAAARLGLAPENVVAGNGSSELLYALPRVCREMGLGRAVLPGPCYGDYARACAAAGLKVETLTLGPEDNFALDWAALAARLEKPALVMLGQPGNPAGVLLDPERVLEMAESRRSSFFLVDEAFADFVPGLFRLATVMRPNLFVLHSLTKFYAVPGLRLGLGYGSAGICAALSALLPDWSVNALAQAVGEKALEDEEYARRTVAAVAELRDRLHDDLAGLGLTVFPGQANYLLCQCRSMDAFALQERLLSSRILIRNCANYTGLDARYFRVAVRSAGENERLVAALSGILAPERPRPAVSRRTPAIMVQGLSSNAGKSVLTAALCRIFLQDGLTAAPFKAQNMSLNSYVTRDGGEMGRAQVLQAQACRLDPDVRMNPVLLKPNSDTGSQVIVLGKPVGNMGVARYIRFKPEIFQTITRAYDELAATAQVMVLEGAGSPAEVNLKSHDVVNMAMARHAGAKVLLAGDIDRGGVFASFVGTMEVMEEWERALVAGFIVNRFRGRQELLGDAMDYVRRFTGVQTLGVVPFIENLGLPEEDSVTFKQSRPKIRDAAVRIAAVDLPHISNFTDLDALGMEPDVSLIIARRPEDLKGADAVILPGSRNVFADLNHLWASGMAQALVSSAAEMVGICGGMQMLGTAITDPAQVESEGRVGRPLGLLPLATEMAVDKVLCQVRGVFLPTGQEVRGYEIHHGQTRVLVGPVEPVMARAEGTVMGWGRPDGMVWGTYLHGVFDADEFRRFFLDRLRRRKGMQPLGAVQVAYDLEEALDRLAAVVRQGLDMERIYGLLANQG
ncbi:MAG: cobyric acid synthase [Desulfovibrionales bacterium]|nr:cobyric acid synthase [Desulfovibrionales bacterium]